MAVSNLSSYLTFLGIEHYFRIPLIAVRGPLAPPVSLHF
jgi:hypothetical protein